MNRRKFLAGLSCCISGVVILAPSAVVAQQHQSVEEVLRPWQPLTVEKNVVIATNKSMVFGRDGKILQMKISGINLLSSPLRIFMDGKEISFRTHDPIRYTASSSEVITVGSEAEHAGGTDVDFRLNTSVWFDGMTEVTVSTDHAAHQLNNHSISYRIELAEGVASFSHRYAELGKRNIDLNSVKSGSIFMSYVPFIWIGNDDIGMYWSSDSQAGWANVDRKDAMTLFKEHGRWVLEVTIHPDVSLDGRWTHRFALLPTPVKELPPNWRKWRLQPAVGANAYVIWPDETQSAAPYFGYPASTRPELLSGYLASLSRSGVMGLPYSSPTWVSTKTPEWKSYGSQWQGGVRDASFEGGKWGGSFVNVCPANANWRNFVHDKYEAYIARFHLSGLYMDNAQVYPIKNCIEYDGHSRGQDFPVSAQRGLFQSIMRGLQRNAASTFAVVHSSGGLNLTSFSSVDAWVSGEQYRDVVQDDYLDVASLLDFRVELNARRWGIIPIFLPEFSAAKAREVGPTRKLMSILLLHDVTPWAQWANVHEINRALGMLDKFGVVNAKFFPYYADHPLAYVNQPGVYISGYQKNSSVLLIVANLNKWTSSVNICTAFTANSVAGFQDESWRRPIPVQQGCFDAVLEAGSYATYLVNGPSA